MATIAAGRAVLTLINVFEAMQKHPKAMPHMAAAARLAKFDPILCEVADSIGAEA
jgi:hypothetical protein